MPNFQKMRYHWISWIELAPIDVNFLHIGFSAILDFLKQCYKYSQATHFVQSSSNLAQMIFGPSHRKIIRWIFDFRNCSVQPIEIGGGEATKQDVRAYLSNALMCWYQSWYMDSGLLPEDVEKRCGVIWPRGGAAISKNNFLPGKCWCVSLNKSDSCVRWHFRKSQRFGIDDLQTKLH